MSIVLGSAQVFIRPKKPCMSFRYRLVIELDVLNEAKKAHEFWIRDEQETTTESTTVRSDLEDSATEDWRHEDVKIGIMNAMSQRDNFIEAEFSSPGIVRLFKIGEEKPDAGTAGDSVLRIPGDDTMISVLFVPSYLSARDLLHSFLGDAVTSRVSHFRIIRSNKDAGYSFILLMKFRDPESAALFKEQYNGRNFNQMDPETCHVIRIKEVVFQERLFPKPQSAGSQFLMNDPFTGHKETGDVELPTCPVCLERLDSEVTGLATIPCQHTFHCQCLNKWKDSRCPVCRYSGLKVTKSSLLRQGVRCSTCGANENLWICLICGNVGCGRYNFKHAVQHFKDTAHFFSMDVATQRVWDYAGDNYVHRLVQNEVDGKLVEVGSSSSRDSSGKRDKEYHLEYVQVLLSQLESQREYYESKLRQLEINEEELKSVHSLQQQIQELKLQAVVTRSKSEHKVNEMRKQLEEERLLSRALQKNLDHLSNTIGDLQKQQEQSVIENQELKEQVTDLMFFLESQEKLKDADESVKQGTLVMKPKKNSRKKK
ncbi:Etp1p [Lachancea thermotolerans CBS 6340]|uniref:KLTH0D07150p n=1 Tax=Lachancea thermotolerans (strain ATCC 56472 / CBS 6340 / NRRL Y-8284) TaxID=559295 RepID=C5DGQ2_LACTC|nr:KLTH0D07150p [Lachancea thermotolerans CBS 6340]CAR22594.1 KLTH0D07150p [Lachancea thermotolerans CBS 6340]